MISQVEGAVETMVEVKQNWMSIFAEWLQQTNRSQATRRAYLMDMAGFARWFAAENHEPFSPELLNGSDLRTYARQVKAANKAATYDRKRSALRVFCNWARLAEYVTYDPFVDIPAGEAADMPTRWLTDAEYHRLIRQMELMVNAPATSHRRREAVRNRTILALGLYAGLREAEISGLAITDIQIHERSGKIIVRNGKGGKRREIPAGREIRLILRQWLELRGEESGPLVGVGVRQIERIVAEGGRQARIEELKPHDLRHTFAKQLIRGGKDLVTISMLLGHTRLETTKRYVQPGWEDFESAVEEL